MQCPRCNEELNKNEKYCHKCGMKIKSRKRKIALIILVALLVLLVIAGSVFFLFFNDMTSKDESNTLSEEEITSLSNENYVSLEEGFTDVKVTDEDTALQAVESVAETLGIDSVEDELKVSDVTAIDGNTYYRMQQYYNDVPVYGRTVIVCINDSGKATMLTSNAIKTDTMMLADVVADFNVDKCIATAKSNFEIDEVISESAESTAYLYVNDTILQCCPVELTYIYNGKIYSYTVFISVSDEKCIKVINRIDENISVSNISGNSKKYDDVELGGDKNENNYYLIDDKRNIICISGIDAESNVTNNTADTSMPKCVDAYTNLQKVYDFFNKGLSIDSFDNKGSGIIIAVSQNGYYYDLGCENIIHDINLANDMGSEDYLGYSVIILGEPENYERDKDGNINEDLIEYTNSPTGAIDVIAHEYSHGIIKSIVPLDNGGISEGICDLFGNLAELDIEGYRENIWELGEKTGSIKYDMSDDITMKSYISESDGHDNAAILSHAGYLMWNGINGDENMKIDTDILAELWYRSLLMMNSDATFEQCADTVTLSAKLMFKSGSLTQTQLNCVEAAFAEVGLGSSLVESGSSLVVYDRYQKMYDNYHIIIKNTFDENTVVDTDISETDKYILDLETGVYTITVSDNTEDGSKNSFSKTVSIIDSLRNIKSEVSLYTDFGVDNTTGDYSNNSDIVAYDNVVYCADNTGVWKTADGGKNKEYISKINPAKNIATNGKIVYFSTFEGEDDNSENLYEKNCSIYCVNADGTDEHKVLDTVALAQPICVKDNILYYSDIKDDESQKYLAATQYLKSYDLSTGTQKVLAENAATVMCFDSKIIYKKLVFSIDDKSAILHSYDTQTGKIEDISDVSAADMKVIDDKLYFSNIQVLDGNKSKIGMYCYNPEIGKTEKLFEKSSDTSAIIQCFNSKYAYYYITDASNGYKYYRANLKENKTEEITDLPDGCNLAYLVGDDVYYRDTVNNDAYYFDGDKAVKIKPIFVDEVFKGYCQGAFFYTDDSYVSSISTKVWSFSESDIIEETTTFTDKEWKNLYIEELGSSNIYNIAALAYINDDDVPELILQSYSILPGTKICWIKDGNVESFDVTGMAGLSYDEKSGLVRFSQLNHGISSTAIYSFDGNNVFLLHRGNNYPGNEYYWDNESVSSSEYQNQIGQYDFEDHGHDFVSIDEIKEVIKNY